MIFWILLALAVTAVVVAYIYWLPDEGHLAALLPTTLTALIALLVGGGLLALALLIPGDKRTEEAFELRAIGSSDTVNGRFFLGSGYVEGRRTLNYIAQEEGWSRLGQAYASASRVYEDTTTPTVTEYTFWYSNGWVIPWEFETGYAWDFHIPEGSVLENYTITNE